MTLWTVSRRAAGEKAKKGKISTDQMSLGRIFETRQQTLLLLSPKYGTANFFFVCNSKMILELFFTLRRFFNCEELSCPTQQHTK